MEGSLARKSSGVYLLPWLSARGEDGLGLAKMVLTFGLKPRPQGVSVYTAGNGTNERYKYRHFFLKMN
jgi:hypothetical protein